MNIKELLNCILQYVKEYPDHEKYFIKDINEMLDNMLNEDMFGTEGQNDPRGDRRN